MTRELVFSTDALKAALLQRNCRAIHLPTNTHHVHRRVSLPDMDMRGSCYVSCPGYVDLHPIRMTSPTCEDLGIPTDSGEEGGGGYPLLARRIIHNPSLHLDGLRYEAESNKLADPYSPLCMIPLPGALALHAATEPSFIRKRNERERERVRCVNDGYERLKEHLPNSSNDKRISKVETLRGAIDYIRHLQQLLDDNPLRPMPNDDRLENEDDDKKGKRTKMCSKSHMKCAAESMIPQKEVERVKRRRGSLSSEQSVLSDTTLSESEDEQLVKRQRVH